MGAQVVLGNTYHLRLRPGVEVIEAAGGLGAFTGFAGHTLTDSGGFQAMSLGAAIDDDGVTFKSVYDGSKHRLDPVQAVRDQERIGADIQMVLDECLAYPADEKAVVVAAERSARWGELARSAHRRCDQSLFGIVQGGMDLALRAQSARRCVDTGFDGYAIGGLSVGEPRPMMIGALRASIAWLPEDQPRYLMGVGDPLGILAGIEAGVDMFDCVAPTRQARHGTVWTMNGPLRVRLASYRLDPEPLDPDCPCPTCQRYSRSYLHHLLRVKEMTVSTLLSLHNLHFVISLTRQISSIISAGDAAALAELGSHLRACYGDQQRSGLVD
jgi:queuine tRNA-ribosyltransferase